MGRSEICGCEHIKDWFYPCPLHVGNSTEDLMAFGWFLETLPSLTDAPPLGFYKGDNWLDV